jgi:hypothetical protein
MSDPFAALYPFYGLAIFLLRIFAVNRAIGGSGCTPA